MQGFEKAKASQKRLKKQTLQDVVVQFLEHQCESGLPTDYATFKEMHPDISSSTYRFGKAKFTRIHKNDPLYERGRAGAWNGNLKNGQLKIARINEYISERYSKYLPLNMDLFLDNNPDISPTWFTQVLRQWEKKHSDDEVARQWLYNQVKREKAALVGQAFERVAIATIFHPLREKGITWYYDTRNFGQSEMSKRRVEGRCLNEDLQQADIGPALRDFLERCNRPEIAVDLTISSRNIADKYRKYPDEITALLVVVSGKSPGQQPLEKNIRIIDWKEFVGPRWLNLPRAVRARAEHLDRARRTVMIGGFEPVAVAKFWDKANKQWTEVGREIAATASHEHYIARVKTRLRDAILRGDASPEVLAYIDGLRASGHVNVADYLEGVARDRANRSMQEETRQDTTGENRSKTIREGCEARGNATDLPDLPPDFPRVVVIPPAPKTAPLEAQLAEKPIPTGIESSQPPRDSRIPEVRVQPNRPRHYQDSKTGQAAADIEAAFHTSRAIKQGEYVAAHPATSEGTFNDALRAVRADHAGDLKFQAWDQTTRVGKWGPNKQDRVADYAEGQCTAGKPIDRAEFLRRNPDISVKTFDNGLWKWADPKRAENDLQFARWNEHVRDAGNPRGQVKAHLRECCAADRPPDREEFLRAHPCVTPQQFENAAKMLRTEHKTEPRFIAWWVANESELLPYRENNAVGLPDLPPDFPRHVEVPPEPRPLRQEKAPDEKETQLPGEITPKQDRTERQVSGARHEAPRDKTRSGPPQEGGDARGSRRRL